MASIPSISPLARARLRDDMVKNNVVSVMESIDMAGFRPSFNPVERFKNTHRVSVLDPMNEEFPSAASLPSEQVLSELADVEVEPERSNTRADIKKFSRKFVQDRDGMKVDHTAGDIPDHGILGALKLAQWTIERNISVILVVIEDTLAVLKFHRKRLEFVFHQNPLFTRITGSLMRKKMSKIDIVSACDGYSIASREHRRIKTLRKLILAKTSLNQNRTLEFNGLIMDTLKSQNRHRDKPLELSDISFCFKGMKTDALNEDVACWLLFSRFVTTSSMAIAALESS
ncbi:hypothetical protein M422DRAFT_56153 [Sphaerobolus stellatus SS14]|uniref:Uncharacterized protein n=1 Tax=Sphaerobolus stellatus (strain SS14) TaxID=990650 RepID=A0A0C9T7L0_SPHS4|nr:hypothetical protein M422DRAFT_56153 [Sphaerobolus stellatus SS14]